MPFSENPNIMAMKIENQNIYGGQQQFADTIINNSTTLDETDARFLKLIHDNTSSDTERQQLVRSLENLKAEDTDEAEKKKSGGLLKKFLESGVSETSKQMVKEIFESGAEYVNYIV
jgi:regulator of replication initiation timing